MHDQDMLNLIKVDQFISDLGLTFMLLHTINFGYICQPNNDFDRVSTMHGNWRFGSVDKLNDLKVILEDWRLYKADPSSFNHKWRIPQLCKKP